MKENVLNLSENLFTKNGYYFAKAYPMAKLYLQDFLNNLNTRVEDKVIVYTIGKVGSTTIFKSLKRLENISAYHVHCLTKDGIDLAEKVYRDSFHRRRKVASHILESRYLRKQLDKGLGGKKRWKVITLVRDPIARSISSFFINLGLTLDYNYQDKVKFTKVEDIVEELIELFLESYDGHEKPLTWFDRELKPVFGIDVFSSEFPKSKGYEIYKTKDVDLLLIRLENLNECGCDAIKKFLNITEFNLIESNVASKKDYQDVYSKFLCSLALPSFYIDKIYMSKYVRHFYSEEEIEKFKAKWYR